ncbi:MAG: hypothetical protein A4E34_02227 [Methanoregula sp. PtaU1.Bin006]|uniref:TIGR00341 family protein n=1 Tax=Methanoregula sp. PtaU1.Bin006 TaxID=1811681 RepID=UPI0009C6C20C|nr:TIGR00341 family protein [Methanoregula sp. PtaU1.Bin006]OPY32850.1 MAG: hypothetical protein A4E34_02227 [Methanoregula sp. PtaU1.Bin006]
MKKVIIEVPKERSEKTREKVKDVLYSISERGEAVRFILYIPDDMLDELIHQTNGSLKKQSRPLWTGLIPDYDTAEPDDRITLIEVSSPDFVISPFVDHIREQFSARKTESRTPIEKILAATEPRTEFDRTTFILAAIAGLVALIGLFLNNVGIIIGAMLLSPLLGPIYALAVYLAIGDIRTTVRCIEVLGLMVFMLAGIAAIATFLLSLVITLPLTPEIVARQDPNDVYILMALLLGFATMTALSKGIPEGIAGVAIAAALLPPAIVTGLSLVLFPAGAAKAAVLTLQNITGLIAGSILGAVFLQIGPRDLLSQGFSRQLIYRILWFLVILIAFLIIVSFLV